MVSPGIIPLSFGQVCVMIEEDDQNKAEINAEKNERERWLSNSQGVNTPIPDSRRAVSARLKEFNACIVLNRS